MPLKTELHSSDVEREAVSHHSLSPLPHRSGGGIYGSTLPALQEPRYNTSSYDHSPSPASATSLYSPYYPPPPTSYPTSTSSYSPTLSGLVSPYTMAPEQSRSRMPSMHSPVARHSSHPTSSARSAYSTATPHTSRHRQQSQRAPKGSSHSPVSPLPPTTTTTASRSLRSPTVAPIPPLMEPSTSPSTTIGPPMGNTHILCNLYSADGVLVEPEVHARIDKGFFMADHDWTCYRRNYFTMVMSYSVKPATHSFPYYLKRTPNSQPENVLAFAMCISAVIDGMGGKPVELVQHTPKRDKGPQHKPMKVKLSPQQAAGMGFSPSHNQQHQSGEYSAYPQQAQLQNVASFERIQFKSATANNGKRRAQQQYYHLVAELWADVGNSTGGPSSIQSESGWVKIACKLSAPMVVRGRSPGHYAEGAKAQTPDENSGSGNGGHHSHSPSSNGHGGMMGGSDMGASPSMGHSVGRLGMGGSMGGFHNMSSLPSSHTSPSSSSIRDPSISTPPPHHLDGLPIDPVITGDDSVPLDHDYTGYHYYPGSIYHPEAPQHHHHQHMYEHMYGKRSEQPLSTNVQNYDQEIGSYMHSNVGQDDRRMGGYRRCGDMGDGSRGYFPDLPAV
ncbi:hypothetical protein DFH27DRAFT_124634 [Peziza echinospora]|nr:hypothetical protein DFH27DRAFT_124634 [Peziza echinospora]